MQMLVHRTTVSLVSKSYLTPNYLRLILKCDDIEAYRDVPLGVNNKLFIPPQGHTTVEMPVFNPETKVWELENEANRPTVRTYTHRFIDLDKTYMFTKVGKRKINYYPKPLNDYGGFLTHRIVRNNSSLNINTKTTRTNIEELNGISTNRINYQTNSIHKRTSGSTTAMDINREIKTKETIDSKTINQPQTVRKNSNTINSTLRLDLQNSLESNNNTYKNNHPNQVLSIANGNFTLSPSYPQVTHVTLQSLSDAKILEIANHYVGTDESLEKFKLNLKK